MTDSCDDPCDDITDKAYGSDTLWKWLKKSKEERRENEKTVALSTKVV
mgnify:CR=1 FL=1